MLRRYTPDDFTTINRWFLSRGLKAPPETYIPDIGFIEPGVAAGFMIQTELPYAIFDLFITNPRADKDHRTVALDLIVIELFRMAKSLDCKTIRAESHINTIRDLAKRHGFEALGDFALFFKEL